MEGRLNKTIRHPQMKVLIDFDDLGYDRRDEWVDITDDILEISGSKEKSGKQLGSVTSDIATFVGDNTNKIFSKDNTNSPYYGKVKSNLRFRLLTGFQGETLVPYASGFVESFSPSWKDKKTSIKTTDFFKLFKEKEVPEEAYQDISWDSLVNILCDHVGLPSFIVRHIPKTEFHYSYFRFEEENCFEALKSLMEIAVGEAYFEQEQFYVKTKLALDYQLDTTVDHQITTDDMFDFEENVDGKNIINSVEVSSQYKSIGPLTLVFETPENLTKVENELLTYDGSGSIFVNQNNLPIVHAEDVPMQLTNITQRKNIRTNGHVPNTGRIEIHPDSLPDVANGDTLSISYSYQQLALLAGKTRKYTFELNQEVDSLASLDISLWDEFGNQQRAYSDNPDTPNTVSRQGMTFNKKTNTVTLTLKNNYASPITISTLQLRGYPIKVMAPIEVFVRDLPSVEEFGKKEVSFQNNYLNNIKLAEKIAQYIVDNNKRDRKRISIEVPGFSEFSLDDISQVTEESSGTSHKFTNERIDYTYTSDSGWTVRTDLLELDSAPWVYESFKGESWEKTNSGVPDEDFLKDINANLVKNGGAELYTGFSDYADIGAIGQTHIVPDYWRFVRSSGNATSRIRDGGNLVLHGFHSFEITTSNSGAGYFEQIINGIKTEETYLLSLVAALTASSGKASVLQYANEVLLRTDSIDITADGPVELMISSLASTTTAVIRIEKLAGTAGSESLVFDKVKFENSKEKTPYIESEETSAVQVGQRYANSLVIGNNYGIEVYDDQNNTRVRMGQYEPNKYGLKIYAGAIEIVNGLPADQVNVGSGTSFEDGYDPSAKIEFYYGDTEPADKNVIWVDTSGEEDLWRRWDDAAGVWRVGPSGPQGIQGPAGQSLFTWVKYADDELGNGMSEYPDGKKYIGLAYNKTTATESSVKADYTWSLIQGNQGPEGPKGDNGESLYTWIKYADSPTTGMSDDPTGKKYMGIAYNKTIPTESGNYGDYSWSLVKGEKGDQGVGISSVTEYYLATSASSGVTTSTSGWTTAIQNITSTNKYLWNYEKITYTDGTSQSTTPIIIGAYGDTGGTGSAGKGISSITEYYLASSSASGVTTATAGWTTTMQTTTPTNKYLWNYEKITYTDGTTSTINPIVIGVHGEKGDKGDTGVGISSITEYYLASASSSGVTTATAGWTTTVQTISSTNKYLWNYEKITYTNGTTENTTPVIIGAYGDTGGTGSAGKSISAITEYYLASSANSGVTRSTSGWSTTMPTLTATNKYLWNYEKVDYVNPTSTSYVEPVIIGVYGDKGDKGDAGVSVTSIVEEYYHSTSATTTTGGTWSTTVPAWADGKYVWTRAKTTFSDGSTSYTSAVNVTGSKGTNGTTYYTWVKYADDASGNGISDTPDGKRYMGIATNKTTATESTTASDYSWSPLYDNVEVGGRNHYKKSTNIANLIGASTITKNPTDAPNGFKLTAVVAGNAVRINNVINSNGFWTISFKAKASVASSINLDMADSSLGSINLTTTLQSFTFTKNVTNYSAATFHFVDIEGLDAANYWFDDIKVEKGNIETDWTPAPEDVDKAIEDVDQYIREDLNLTASLPTSIAMDQNGITAYTSDNAKYARLDYRGLYVAGGAIQIDGGLPASQMDSTVVNNSNRAGTYIDQNGVYTGELQADSVKARHIDIADTTNIVLNSDLNDGITGFSGASLIATASAKDPSQIPTNYVLQHGTRDVWYGDSFPITAEEVFYCAVMARFVSGNTARSFGIGLSFTGPNNQITWIRGTSFDAASNTKWEHKSGTVKAPSWATHARVWIQVDQSSSVPDAIWQFTLAVVKRNGMLSFDQAQGGTLTLGGTNNGYGRMIVLDGNGDQIADLDAAAGGFQHLYVGDLESPTVVRYGTDTLTFYVAGYASASQGVAEPDDNNGGTAWSMPLATVGEALRRIPKHWDGTATINIAYGHKIYEEINVNGFSGGGSIVINGQTRGTIIVGRFMASANTVTVRLENVTLNTTNDYSAVSFWWTDGYVLTCTINGLANNGTGYGIDVIHGSFVQAQDTQVYSCANAITGRYGGTCMVINCTGYAGSNGLYCYGGYITGGGTAPAGAANTKVSYGGSVDGAFTHNSGSYSPPPPPETTKTVAATSGDNWSSSYATWMGSSDGVKQGNYGYGRRTGLWFFGAGVLNTIGTGKTIKRMRLYIQRESKGGSSGSVNHYVVAHGYQSKPAGAPSVSGTVGNINLAWGGAGWVTINSSVYASFANGTYRGFGIYVASDSSSYYSQCKTSATIEVTYA